MSRSFFSRKRKHLSLNAVNCAFNSSILSTYLGPDILAFQEVENQNALLQLKNNYFEGMGNRYALFIPTEGAAVNLALLSRFPIVNVQTHCFDLRTTYSPRNIVEVEINCYGDYQTHAIRFW